MSNKPKKLTLPSKEDSLPLEEKESSVSGNENISQGLMFAPGLTPTFNKKLSIDDPIEKEKPGFSSSASSKIFFRVSEMRTEVGIATSIL